MPRWMYIFAEIKTLSADIYGTVAFVSIAWHRLGSWCRCCDNIITPPWYGSAEYVMSVSVCLCVCVCLSAFDHISGTTCPIFTIFFCMLPMAVARSSSDGTLRISCFVDDVIFAHKLIGCSTSPPGWGVEARTYAALGLARRNTRWVSEWVDLYSA